MVKPEYFDGFSWPVPKAFSDALAKCRFECGDLLYSDGCAYELPWGQAKNQLSYSIQIILPQSSTGSSTNQSFDGIFRTNWKSDVEFELTSYRSNDKRRIRTCQGNLYKMLRDGSLSCIESQSPLPVPITLSEVNNDLESLPFEKKEASQFLLPFDVTSEILKAKRVKIEKTLRSKSSISVFPARTLNHFIGRDILPTIEIIVFDVDLQRTDVECLIKKAVYVPSKHKKTDRERFRIRDHGLLR